MSFGSLSRQVSDPDRGGGGRFFSFLACAYQLGRWNGEGMRKTYERVGRQLGFSWEERPTTCQLEAAIDILRAEWIVLMKRHDDWVQARRRAKALGRRQLSKVERSELSRLGWRHG
jgi:hypothetical protein